MISLREQYMRDGFAHARGVLPVAQIDATIAEMNEVVVQQSRRLKQDVSVGHDIAALYANMQILHAASIPAYLASLTLWAKLFSIHSLIMYKALRDIAGDLGIKIPVFQTQPVMHVVSDKLLIPNGYQGFDAHQDWTALQSGLDTMGIWIPFMPIDRDLYTMDVIPGSHRRGLCSGEQGKHVFIVSPECYSEDEFVPVEVEPGDVFLMTIFTIHRSSTRGRPGALRISCSARYENAAERTFIDRQYPFTQKRIVERATVTEGFPSVEQVRNAYPLVSPADR
jgi:hypothetical protein